jgi:hypothetical protein
MSGNGVAGGFYTDVVLSSSVNFTMNMLFLGQGHAGYIQTLRAVIFRRYEVSKLYVCRNVWYAVSNTTPIVIMEPNHANKFPFIFAVMPLSSS